MKKFISLLVLIALVHTAPIHSRWKHKRHGARIKPVLLVIAAKGYQPAEYAYARTALESAGLNVMVASNNDGIAVAAPDESGQHTSTWSDMPLASVDVREFEGVFFIGGPLVLQYLDNEESYRVARDAIQHNVPLGAISYAPRILAQAGVLTGRFATGWNGDNYLPYFYRQLGVKHVPACAAPVVVDGKIATSEGRNTAAEFGRAITEMVQLHIALRLKEKYDHVLRMAREISQQYLSLVESTTRMSIPKERITQGVYLYWPAKPPVAPAPQRQVRRSMPLARPYLPQDYLVPQRGQPMHRGMTHPRQYQRPLGM